MNNNQIYSELTNINSTINSNNFFNSLFYKGYGNKIVNIIDSFNLKTEQYEILEGFIDKSIKKNKETNLFKTCKIRIYDKEKFEEVLSLVKNDERIIQFEYNDDTIKFYIE